MPSRHKLFMSTIFANRKNNHTDKKQRFPKQIGNRCFLIFIFCFHPKITSPDRSRICKFRHQSCSTPAETHKQIKIFRSCVIVAYFHATFAAKRGIGERGNFFNPSEAKSKKQKNQLEYTPANSGTNPAQSLPKPRKKIKIFRNCVIVAHLHAIFGAFRGIGEKKVF